VNRLVHTRELNGGSVDYSPIRVINEKEVRLPKSDQLDTDYHRSGVGEICSTLVTTKHWAITVKDSGWFGLAEEFE